MSTIIPLYFIATNPNIRSGRPFLTGTTVTVADVVIAFLYRNLEPHEITLWFSISLAQVFAALAYYYEHREKLSEQIAEQIERAESLKERRVGNERSKLNPSLQNRSDDSQHPDE